jgi:biopolymer transport protein ExbD
MGRRKERAEPAIPIDSFSDIAFLLIVFFMVATTLSQLAGVKTQIPSGAKSDAPPEKTTMLNLHDQEISLNDEKLELAQLQERLTAMNLKAKTGNDKIILVETTGAVPYQRYFEVVTMITAAGGAIAMVEQEEAK